MVKYETSSLFKQMEQTSEANIGKLKKMVTVQLRAIADLKKANETQHFKIDQRVTQLEADSAARALAKNQLAVSDPKYENDLNAMLKVMKSQFDILRNNITKVIVQHKKDVDTMLKN